MNEKEKLKIGFIGQGWIGKNYADDFEERGFDVIRYAKEEFYKDNKKAISGCDIVFIAVPTPSTPEGFSSKIVSDVLSLIGKGKVAVIKSTVTMGTTNRLQKENPNIIVVHSPEFLSEATAHFDVRNPGRNIVGIPKENATYRNAAKTLLSIFPEAPYSAICSAEEAEMIKYSHNISGYFQVILFNMFYDLAEKHKCDWVVLKDAFLADPMMSHQYLNPIHKSGRGAGGHCFIKDFSAFVEMYKDAFPADNHIHLMLENMQKKNNSLLRDSKKDLDILKEVHGEV